VRKINTRNYRLATRATPREVNRRIVLNLIREHQPISRAELARRMNVRRAALTAIVRDLIQTGDVYETGRAVSVRGRRPTLIRVCTSGRLAVAVDVRPERTSVALADFSGAVLERSAFATPSDPAILAEQLVSHVKTILMARESADGEPSLCRGIGIVVPGMVDRRSGQIIYAPRLGWRDVHLRDAVHKHIDLPISVEAAPIACALARLWLMTGEPRAVNNFAYVSVSDGVGVGMVIAGEVLRGEHHTAGELGHVSLDPNGPACACGRRGCWEAFACNAATIARYTDAVSGARASDPSRRETNVAVEEIIRRAMLGEPAAAAALTETGKQIGRGIAAVVAAYNPKRIYVGGEVTAAWGLLEPPLRDAVNEGTLTDLARGTPVYPDLNPAEYRLLGAVALVAAPTFAALRVG
jgi:N-acetylglucosamine repressor